ncbi:hypothetical protein [Tautonia marina]|uniref:hypothetical protein n=1 Tax=Tautonia marina TaxID=2653855 RepID=UPI00126104D5|nr:hypothetical protein [Tautonia marina]
MRVKSWRLAPDRAAIAVGIGLLLTCWSGCGSGPPVAASEDQAREVLNAALEGWQGGASIEDLKESSPSIVVSDPKWSGGTRLSRFEVEGEGKPAGAERLFTVTLWLEGNGGEEVAETVEYKVGTDPIRTVFRAIF